MKEARMEKHLLDPERLRKIPPQFSWIDQRLVRERHIERLSHAADALYLFLVTVADARGLSFYSERSIGRYLAMAADRLDHARKELLRADLIAYQQPLYQVLSLDGPRLSSARGAGDLFDQRNLQTAGRCRMIDYELYCKLRHLKDHEALSAHQIAGELAMDPRTVAKWLARERFCPEKSKPARSSKLDPFKTEIARMLEAHAFTAAQILVRIREQGYAGGYSIVKDYVRTIRPPKRPAYLTLAFAPGECAQVDWGSYGSVAVGNTRRRLSFFVMVLCYSRMLYVEFTVSQSLEHFLACHQNAFDFFGRVPQKIMVDNLKSAVLRRMLGRPPVFNPRYLDFANHYGFTIAPCNVGRGNEKGRVENAVGYVKKNFLAGLEIPDFAALGPAARSWLETVANVRLHGETRKKPVELFEAERPCLLPLPVNPFDIATVSQQRASSQFRITLDTNRYSVPAEYADKTRLRSKPTPNASVSTRAKN